jgi:hypothetical protein
MRLYLINPSKPACKHRQSQGEPLEPLPRVGLSLMVLAGLTPPEWEISHIGTTSG